MKGKTEVGYRNRTNKCGDLSVKIKDAELAQSIKDHCKMINVTTSDFVSDCVKKCMADAYGEYLKTLPKDELISMLLQKGR